MSDTRTQRLLAAVFDGEAIADDLVRDLALSSDGHGELVRLAAVLARLPGDGARAAELRLDNLLDDVSLIAASESRVPSGVTGAARRFAGQQPPAGSSDPRASSRFGVAAPTRARAAPRIHDIRRRLLTGVAAAATVVAIVIAWSSRDAGVTTSTTTPPAPPRSRVAPPPGPASSITRPALVDVEIRVSTPTAQISIDGHAVDGNPFAGQYRSDDMIHHIRVNAPGYISKVMSVAFNSNVRLDISLEHAEATDRVVAIAPPAMAIPPPTRSAPMSAAIVDLPPVARRAITPAVPTDMPAGSADVLYASGQHHDELHNYAAALAAFEKWLAEADATTLHRRDVEQSIARLRLLVGKVMITADAPCEIAIDDVVVGKTPLQESLLVNVNVGRRKITFLRAGHAVETRFVDVVAADTIQLKASLVHVDAVEAGSKPTRPIDTTSPYGGDP